MSTNIFQIEGGAVIWGVCGYSEEYGKFHRSGGNPESQLLKFVNFPIVDKPPSWSFAVPLNNDFLIETNEVKISLPTP